eukprot:TRINITY_DN9176_c0_g2_i1.p1 TRINITY_DN9176_c0_g2~~TRINITY_DN9176_c0_g2_i1.p1  ORF type:complete len:295 (+),score=24.16 TRINITY_DN9176_c0_g2_i1:73-957(+)
MCIRDRNNDEYEGTLSFEKGAIKISFMKVLEILHWKSEFSMKTLTALDKRWQSLLEEGIIFDFMLKSFENAGVVLSETDDTGLKIEFKYQMGYASILLPIYIKREKLDIEKVIVSQGASIKNLLMEKKDMQETIKQLTEELKILKNNTREVFVLFKENIGSSPSTYSLSFVDISGLKPATITIRKKSSAKWGLFVNGLQINSGGGGYHFKFRLMLTNSTTNKTEYWPSENGCSGYAYDSSGAHIGFSFSFEDIAEMKEGTYTVKLQWANSSNSSSYPISYLHNRGELRVIIDTY